MWTLVYIHIQKTDTALWAIHVFHSALRHSKCNNICRAHNSKTNENCENLDDSASECDVHNVFILAFIWIYTIGHGARQTRNDTNDKSDDDAKPNRPFFLMFVRVTSIFRSCLMALCLYVLCVQHDLEKCVRKWAQHFSNSQPWEQQDRGIHRIFLALRNLHEFTFMMDLKMQNIRLFCII